MGTGSVLFTNKKSYSDCPALGGVCVQDYNMVTFLFSTV